MTAKVYSCINSHKKRKMIVDLSKIFIAQNPHKKKY
jgi:hypothetical protein